MRGYYEKQWQDALAGASIQPSETLWVNIENSMTNNNGSRMWMTLLLAAATVTLAFAFPLTIGNSSFEARPDAYQFLTESTVQDSKGINEVKTDDSSPINQEAQIVYKVRDGAETRKTIQVNYDEKFAVGELNNNLKPMVQPNDIYTLNTISFGLEDIDMGTIDPFAQLATYYLIPYYFSASSVKRNLLASLNIGTGSASSGGALKNFGPLESADMMVESSNNLSNADNRSEVNGSTYYFGAGVELPVGERWSFLSGLGYLTQTAIGTSNIVLDNGSSYQPVGAYDPILPGTVFLGEAYDYTVKNSYINIPITLKYSVINKKFKIRGGVGLSTDFMLSHNLNSEKYGSANYDPSAMDFKPVVLAGLINLDFSYNLSNRYSVAMETGVRRGLTSIDNSKEYYPSSFTVGLILLYKIQR